MFIFFLAASLQEGVLPKEVIRNNGLVFSYHPPSEKVLQKLNKKQAKLHGENLDDWFEPVSLPSFEKKSFEQLYLLLDEDAAPGDDLSKLAAKKKKPKKVTPKPVAVTGPSNKGINMVATGLPASAPYNQGNIGSCTANALAFIVRYFTGIPMSRLYQYANTRVKEAKIDTTQDTLIDRNIPSVVTQDTGASLTGSIIALYKMGICPESANINVDSVSVPSLQGVNTFSGWGYDMALWGKQPPPDAYETALSNPSFAGIAKRFVFFDALAEFKKSGQSNFMQFVASTYLSKGYLLYLGVILGDSIYSVNSTGVVKTPNPKSFNMAGGHAITVVGIENGMYKFVNSWGPNWGKNGYGYFNEDYLDPKNMTYLGCPFNVEMYAAGYK